MKQIIEQLIFRAIKEILGEESNVEAMGLHFAVTYPPTLELGDYASNAGLILSRKLQQKGKDGPQALAERIIEEIKKLDTEGNFQSISATGGFINFKLSIHTLFANAQKVLVDGDRFGSSESINPQKIMVEYLSPNTNKPLHLGHLRNGVIGVAISNLLVAQGNIITKVGIINDRGVHICKAMLAYQKWGNNETPESTEKKPDHFVGDWYVKFAEELAKDPNLEQEAQEMLQKWEAGDSETRRLWETVRGWVLEGWKETEKVLGFKYDKAYFESDVYEQGKEIVEQGLAKGVFRKNEKGNVVFDLSVEEFGLDHEGDPRVITVLRPDGTSLYTTQDLGLAVRRAEEYHLSKLIYVVGSEQKFHFQSLFAMLKALGYEWAKNLYHLWYGMVYLPDGKMKSREGTVVDADELVTQMVGLAKFEVVSRVTPKQSADEISKSKFQISNKISSVQIEHRATIIALGAIKFFLLKQKPTTDITFNPKESISFEGFTGPYLQYTHARIYGILRKGGFTAGGKLQIPDARLEDEELSVLRKLTQFQEAITQAATDFSPNIICTYLFELAQNFNTFYEKLPVLKETDEQIKVFRLQLIQATAQVIKNGLNLLGIEAPEEM